MPRRLAPVAASLATFDHQRDAFTLPSSIVNSRRGGGGRRDHAILVAETTTMIVIGLIIRVFGIVFFCWLPFTLANYALPFFAGLTAGLAALHGGAGVLGETERSQA